MHFVGSIEKIDVEFNQTLYFLLFSDRCTIECVRNLWKCLYLNYFMDYLTVLWIKHPNSRTFELSRQWSCPYWKIAVNIQWYFVKFDEFLLSKKNKINIFAKINTKSE